MEERRHYDRDWRDHVDARLDRQDAKLDNIEVTLTELKVMLGIFHAGKIGAVALKWLVTVAAAIAAIYGALHLGGK